MQIGATENNKVEVMSHVDTVSAGVDERMTDGQEKLVNFGPMSLSSPCTSSSKIEWSGRSESPLTSKRQRHPYLGKTYPGALLIERCSGSFSLWSVSVASEAGPWRRSTGAGAGTSKGMIGLHGISDLEEIHVVRGVATSGRGRLVARDCRAKWMR